MGIPNPIAATPAAATTMPNNDKMTDMLYAPPDRAVLGSSHGAMVSEEFRPRSALIAITNVALQRPDPIVINTRP
jgi:hypothetical protein